MATPRTHIAPPAPLTPEIAREASEKRGRKREIGGRQKKNRKENAAEEKENMEVEIEGEKEIEVSIAELGEEEETLERKSTSPARKKSKKDTSKKEAGKKGKKPISGRSSRPARK